jgi:hypothetical protein
MPGMCRPKKAEKIFRDIMGEPQNASKKISIKIKTQVSEKTQPINTAYDVNNEDRSYENP